MKLNYTPEAISDLQEIKRYIKSTLHNPTAARRISKAILTSCSSLKAFPKRGRSIESITGFETAWSPHGASQQIPTNQLPIF